MFHFFFPPLSLSFNLPITPSSMPWVGGHRRRWEVRAQVCAGNHGNPVLIGQWPGRMIVSCCQWGAVYADKQQGWTAPDGSFRYQKKRNNKENLSSSLSREINLFRSSCWEWMSSSLLATRLKCVCFLGLSFHEKQQHQSFKQIPQKWLMLTFRWQSPVEAGGVITPVCWEPNKKIVCCCFRARKPTERWGLVDGWGN